MKTFRKFIFETDYPGAYYDEDGEVIQHFNTHEDKLKYDDENPDHPYEYISDKRMKRDKAVKSAISTISTDILSPIAQTALKTALGEGLLSEIPIEQIENSIEKLDEEIEKIDEALSTIRKMIQEEHEEKMKEYLSQLYEHKVKRRKQLVDAKNKLKQS